MTLKDGKRKLNENISNIKQIYIYYIYYIYKYIYIHIFQQCQTYTGKRVKVL